MNKWEYQLDTYLSYTTLSEGLDSRGEQGWELVAFVIPASGYYQAVYKRPNGQV